MAKVKVDEIRNVIFAGHGGTGKTSLVDEILYLSKASNRLGSVKDGTSLSDTADDEIEAQASIDLSMFHCTYNKKLFHILDTPGRSDFIGQAYCALRAGENVLITVDAYSGIQVNTRKFWKIAREQKKAIAFVLTKLDLENVDLKKIIEDIQENFGSFCVPFFLPDTTGGSISQLYSVLSPSDGAPEEVKTFTEPLIESIVESDEDLMMRYLEGEDISSEIDKQAGIAIAKGELVPILCCAQKDSLGAKELLETVATYFPSPLAVTEVKVIKEEKEKLEDGSEKTVTTQEEKELKSNGFVGQVFKIVVDEHKGNLAVIRVLAGEVSTGTSGKNLTTGKSFKFGKLFKFFGNKQEEVPSVVQGEIFGAAKIDGLHISDTVVSGDWKDILTPINFPNPMVALAIKPKTRSDESRISGVLSGYVTEDPTFRTEVDRQTKELVIYGMSELHLNTILHRMEKKNRVSVDCKLPQISYRETVTKESDENYQHKKQSGGAGEYAKVFMKMRPYQAKDKNFNFINALKGENVKRQFVPSVEKGCVAIMEQGILTGSPIIWVEVEFYDGKDHPVDSKDVAFQKAAKECFRKCFMASGPVLLEPMVTAEVVTPTEFAGDISQYISSHRGKITGVDMLGKEQVTKCSIPLAEVQNFSSDLRSMTQDQGSYTMDFAGYEQIPPQVQKQVVEKYQADKEAARS